MPDFVSYLLPAHWASALINGDPSGLEDFDLADLKAVLNGEGLGYCAGIDERDSLDLEPEFCWHHDASPYGVLACDCLPFLFVSLEVVA
jgi:hypothetical protein